VKDAKLVHPSKSSIEAHIVSLLAGRAAEEIVLGDPSAEVKELLGGLGAKFFAPTIGFCR